MNHRTTDDRTIDRAESGPAVHGKWASALVALFGLWLGTWAVLGGPSGVQFWNDLAVGAILTVAGGSNYVRRANGRPGSVAAAVVAVAAGGWLIAVQFVFDFLPGLVAGGTSFAVLNDVFVGMAVALIGCYSAYEASQARSRATRGAGR